MRFAVVVATCLAVSGCSATQTAISDLVKPLSEPSTGKDDLQGDLQSLVSETYNYKSLVGYAWNGRTYATQVQLNAAIDEAIARDMAKLVRPAPVDAALRALRINPRNAATVPEIANLRLAEARFEALRKSGLFSSIRVENSGPGKFVARGGDYVLQFDGMTWLLRDGEDRQITVGNGADLSVFVSKVAAAVAKLRDDADYLYVLRTSPGPKGAEMIAYRDEKYPALVSLVDAFDRVNAALAPQVTPATKPLGGRALVVLPRHAPDRPMLRAGENPGLIDSARRAYRLALDKRFVRFVQTSKLFAGVTVVFADEVGAIPMDYDWVLWRAPNDATWSGRSRDDDFGSLALSTQPGGFAAALAQALTLPPDPELDVTEPPGPVPDTLAPRFYAR